MATKDIFNNESGGWGGAFSANKAKMNLGSGLEKLLVTQMSANYQRPIQRVFELTSNKTFYIEGRSQGQASFGNIVGPKGFDAAAYEALSDVCAKTNMTFSFGEGSCEKGNGGRKLEHVVLTSAGMSVSADQMMINEQMQVTFGRMLTT